MLTRAIVASVQSAVMEGIDGSALFRRDSAEMDEVRGILEAATASVLADDISEHLEGIGDRVQRHSRADFARLGVRLRDAEPPLGGIIEAWRSNQVAKIRSLMTREVRAMGKLLAENEGQHSRVLRDLIQERFDVTRSKADLLARDQVLTLNAQVTKSRFTAAGVTQYIWTTSGDERVRESHAELDGQTFSFDAPPVISPDGRTGNPGDDYQCRCTAYPVLPNL